jgi:hypothetical protein
MRLLAAIECGYRDRQRSERDRATKGGGSQVRAGRARDGADALGGLLLYLGLAAVMGLGKSIQRHVRVRAGGQGWTDVQGVLASRRWLKKTDSRCGFQRWNEEAALQGVWDGDESGMRRVDRLAA